MELEVRILGSGREVGRAAIAIGSGDKYLLLDYGVIFDEADVPILPNHIQPNKVEALLITHAHLDHIGAAPMLYVSRKIPAYMTKFTRDVAPLMLTDFLKISGYYLPYEAQEVEAFINSTNVIDYGEEVEVGDFRIKALNAGHIPGSAMFTIHYKEHSILYTGDVNTIETKLVRKPNLNGIEAETLIIEGTYGTSNHPPRNEVEDDFINSVKEVIEGGGVVLVPAFSLGRSQEILAVLAEKAPHIDVRYDGMVKEILKLMLRSRKFINRFDLLAKARKRFVEVKSFRTRKKVVKEPGVIVASAGMLKGGPAVYYAKKLQGNSRNAIFLVSYQARGTPGRKLLEEGVLEENGPRVKAKVKWFDFSSHAGVNGLLGLVKKVKGLERVIVVHSEPETGEAFSKLIKSEVGVDVIYPTNGDVIKLG